METATLLILSTNFLFIGLLPKIFFRQDGHYNMLWFVTAAPFFIGPIFFCGLYFQVLTPAIPFESSVYTLTLGIGTLCNLVSVGLIALTIGTHRVPLSLWHQSNDAPRHIVTWGAYARIRHPFYTSFILAFIGCVLAAPHVGVLVLLCYTILVLNHTAAMEERKLSNTDFGDEYKAYMATTGRFFPRFNIDRNKPPQPSESQNSRIE